MSPTLGKASNMTPYQIQILVRKYEANSYLRGKERRQLAQSLNTSEEKIRYWFSDRRKRQMKSGKLRDGE